MLRVKFDVALFCSRFHRPDGGRDCQERHISLALHELTIGNSHAFCLYTAILATNFDTEYTIELVDLS